MKAASVSGFLHLHLWSRVHTFLLLAFPTPFVPVLSYLRPNF
jgi:hypothetical protein